MKIKVNRIYKVVAANRKLDSASSSSNLRVNSPSFSKSRRRTRSRMFTIVRMRWSILFLITQSQTFPPKTQPEISLGRKRKIVFDKSAKLSLNR